MLTICLQSCIVANVDRTSTQYLGEKGEKNMVDTQLLDKRISESGKGKGYLSGKLGISIQSFRLKRTNVYPFTTDEVTKLCDELNITKLSDKERLFFAKNVDKTST